MLTKPQGLPKRSIPAASRVLDLVALRCLATCSCLGTLLCSPSLVPLSSKYKYFIQQAELVFQLLHSLWSCCWGWWWDGFGVVPVPSLNPSLQAGVPEGAPGSPFPKLQSLITRGPQKRDGWSCASRDQHLPESCGFPKPSPVGASSAWSFWGSF